MTEFITVNQKEVVAEGNNALIVRSIGGKRGRGAAGTNLPDETHHAIPATRKVRGRYRRYVTGTYAGYRGAIMSVYRIERRFCLPSGQ